MKENSDEYILPLDTRHSLRKPKQVEDIVVQVSDLKRLRWHLERVKIPVTSYDWPSAIIGAIASLIIPFIIDLCQGRAFMAYYLIVFAGLAIALSIVLSVRNKRLKELNPQQSLDEAIQDIKSIYEKANLPYPNQYDHATVSAQADHINR